MSLHSLLSCVPQSCLIKMFLHIMMPNCMTSSLLVPFLSSSLTLPHCHDATLYGIFTLGLLLAFFPIVITVGLLVIFSSNFTIVMMSNCMTSSLLVSLPSSQLSWCQTVWHLHPWSPSCIFLIVMMPKYHLHPWSPSSPLSWCQTVWHFHSWSPIVHAASRLIRYWLGSSDTQKPDWVIVAHRNLMVQVTQKPDWVLGIHRNLDSRYTQKPDWIQMVRNGCPCC